MAPMQMLHIGDDRGPQSAFNELAVAFKERLQELQRFTYLRIEEGSRDLFTQDLVGLEASVRALEDQATRLRQHLQKESAALPKVEAVIQAFRLQSDRLHSLGAAAGLQSLPAAPGHSLYSQRDSSQGGQSDQSRGTTSGGGAAAGDPGVSREPRVSADDPMKKPRDTAPPCWLITEGELHSISSYMRGRLTLEKVNAAVLEVVAHAEANSRLMAAARSQGGSKLTSADRKRATELLHSVANKEGVKGQHWFVDSDLRNGVALKMDKTGKNMLSLLRHLQRTAEVRCSIDGVSTTVYVLQARQT